MQNLKTLTILYAEDEQDTLKITANILEDYVKEIIVARDGQEALEIFNACKVDLILTDILMPRLNGLELIKAVRNGHKNPSIPIIITSAHAEVQYLLEAIKLRTDGYILKPINIEELLSTLNRVMLPILQQEMIQAQTLLINTISTFIGGKKIEIIRYLLNNVGEDHIFRGSYQDIIETLNVSKPTVVKTFKQLIDTGIITKIRNKIYKLHPNVIPQD
ncbi:regulator [Helicobacter enhydrae]|uniref:Regulator n=1 Tax=Helicobacter enhydrae TaxID=222136 RepID=A0A1B1U721_9HELI|nr:response regulator [Helicobacter enhydrae]ANV98492.1 regulator [Helicobacter enhydrae]